MSDQRADSIAYSEIPYATEQGISQQVSGKLFEEQGIAPTTDRRVPKPATSVDRVFGGRNGPLAQAEERHSNSRLARLARHPIPHESPLTGVLPYPLYGAASWDYARHMKRPAEIGNHPEA